MSLDITAVGAQKVKSIPNGESVELKSLWQDQNVAIVFFRRWGCMLCRLWAKELGEIAPVLQKNNVKLVGVGVEEAGSKEFVEGKFFDGDLYYVEDLSTYQSLGFKRFNVITILTSLLWKQSREAISKGRGMGLGGDLKGDWVQTGGALLVEKGGKVLNHFVQHGPGDHLSNLDILKHFGLESEYKPETMANKKIEERGECARPRPRHWLRTLEEHSLAPIHTIWAERRCKHSKSVATTRASVGTPSSLVMLLLAARTVCGRPCYEGSAIDLCFYVTSITDEDSNMDSDTDYREYFANYFEKEFRNIRNHEIMRRSETVPDTEDHKNSSAGDYEKDVVDREDHVTQHLSELLVNTDSEITGLQASDVEETREEANSAYSKKEDSFFTFLTGQEDVMDIDGVLSSPAKLMLDESDRYNAEPYN